MSIVRYSMSGPVAKAIAVSIAVAILFICGWTAITDWHDPVMRPVMREKGFAILALLAAGFLVGPVLFVTHRVQIEVDHGAGTLLLRKNQWPLRSQVRTFPLVRVTDAVVESENDGENVRYMVFLVVEGEPAVPLVEGMWHPAKERHDKAAAAIRAMLPLRAPLA